MPVVTQTTARSGVRPVAKAFGTSVSAMATRGLGMSAIAQSRSTSACSWGACSGVTTRARMADSAIVSLNHHWAKSMPPAMASTNQAEKPSQMKTTAATT